MRTHTEVDRPLLSPVVAGTWRLMDWQWSAEQTLAWIEANLDHGIDSFDLADIYGGYRVEAAFGAALALRPGLRVRLKLVGKCDIRLVHPARPEHRVKSYDTSAVHLRQSVETTLRDLRTDHLELLLLHRPDALMDADEVAECFEALRSEGKVGAFGVSNFLPSEVRLLNSRVPLQTNQVQCSLLHLDPLRDGSFDLAQELRMRPMVWSPLAGGRLFTDDSERSVRMRSVLGEVAAELQCSSTALALAWVMRHPSRPHPIVGSHRAQTLTDAQAAAGVAQAMSREQWWRLWTASTGHPVP